MRGILWILAGLALLGGGFLAFSFGIVELQRESGRIPEDQWPVLRDALLLYSRIVLFKGLLPQLLVSQLLWWGIAVAQPGWAERLRSWTVGCALVASGVFLAVAPSLLTHEGLGMPALVIEGVGRWLSSYVAMTAAVVLAMTIPRRLLVR